MKSVLTVLLILVVLVVVCPPPVAYGDPCGPPPSLSDDMYSGVVYPPPPSLSYEYEQRLSSPDCNSRLALPPPLPPPSLASHHAQLGLPPPSLSLPPPDFFLHPVKLALPPPSLAEHEQLGLPPPSLAEHAQLALPPHSLAGHHAQLALPPPSLASQPTAHLGLPPPTLAADTLKEFGVSHPSVVGKTHFQFEPLPSLSYEDPCGRERGPPASLSYSPPPSLSSYEYEAPPHSLSSVDCGNRLSGGFLHEQILSYDPPPSLSDSAVLSVPPPAPMIEAKLSDHSDYEDRVPMQCTCVKESKRNCFPKYHPAHDHALSQAPNTLSSVYGAKYASNPCGYVALKRKRRSSEQVEGEVKTEETPEEVMPKEEEPLDKGIQEKKP